MILFNKRHVADEVFMRNLKDIGFFIIGFDIPILTHTKNVADLYDAGTIQIGDDCYINPHLVFKVITEMGLFGVHEIDEAVEYCRSNIQNKEAIWDYKTEYVLRALLINHYQKSGATDDKVEKLIDDLFIFVKNLKI